MDHLNSEKNISRVKILQNIMNTLKVHGVSLKKFNFD